MLSDDIIQALKTYTQNMQKHVTFVVQSGEHAKKEELMGFLEGVAGASDKLRLEQRDTQGRLRSPMSFFLEVDEHDSGISFSGVPAGHEFNSLVLAMLQASGTPIKLDESLQSLIAQAPKDLDFEVFVSLSCHNCPDVVQALNQFALLSPRIRTEMIDGGVFPELIEHRDIQGVPSVYLNGELFANGKVTASELVAKLIERFPTLADGQSQSSLPVQDVMVIGGGPAGVSATIYAARKGLKVTMVADRIGGQVKDTMDIENLISVPKTTGPRLSADLQAHMDEYDITLKEHLRVSRIDQGDIKSVTLSSGEIIQTKAIIVATGAKWRELGVPGEKDHIGNGVAYCPHCDGPFFKGKDVAVIGGGNSGIEAALDLAGIVKSVTVFEFMSELKADRILVEKAEAKSNIRILKNVATKSIQATDGKVSAIEYIDRTTDDVHTQALHGVFVQIGLVPNSGFLQDVVERTRAGEIVINEKCETSQPGIFACGDVTTVPYKQIVVSMGEGAKASLAAFEYLLAHGDELELGSRPETERRAPLSSPGTESQVA